MLSIVTINYNNYSGLKVTMDSLLRQSDPNFEWIVVDGHSNDQSMSLINLNKDKFSNIQFVSEPDDGIYHAMNKGIKLSRGSHLIFLNSGDFFFGHDSVKIIKSIIAYENDAILLFGFFYKNTYRYPRSKYWCYWKMPTSHQAMIFPKLNFLNGAYDQSYRFAADYDFFVRCFKSGSRFVRLNNILIANEEYGSDSSISKVCLEYSKVTKKYFFLLHPFVSKIRCFYDRIRRKYKI